LIWVVDWLITQINDSGPVMLWLCSKAEWLWSWRCHLALALLTIPLQWDSKSLWRRALWNDRRSSNLFRQLSSVLRRCVYLFVQVHLYLLGTFNRTLLWSSSPSAHLYSLCRCVDVMQLYFRNTVWLRKSNLNQRFSAVNWKFSCYSGFELSLGIQV
jgi:hypothetical protein